MKLFFSQIIKFVFFLLFFSCVKTDNLNINGTWNLHSMQCKTYNYYQDYSIILTETDSLGKNALIILPSKDTLTSGYNLISDEYLEFTTENIGDWQGKHQIEKWTATSLNFKVVTDSCTVLFQFKR